MDTDYDLARLATAPAPTSDQSRVSISHHAGAALRSYSATHSSAEDAFSEPQSRGVHHSLSYQARFSLRWGEPVGHSIHNSQRRAPLRRPRRRVTYHQRGHRAGFQSEQPERSPQQTSRGRGVSALLARGGEAAPDMQPLSHQSSSIQRYTCSPNGCGSRPEPTLGLRSHWSEPVSAQMKLSRRFRGSALSRRSRRRARAFGNSSHQSANSSAGAQPSTRPSQGRRASSDPPLIGRN